MPYSQAQGMYQLPPLSKGLQPSLSETADVWRGVLGGAAKGLMDHFNELDKHLKGPPSIAQTIVRAYQVRHILLPTCGQRVDGHATEKQASYNLALHTRLSIIRKDSMTALHMGIQYAWPGG